MRTIVCFFCDVWLLLSGCRPLDLYDGPITSERLEIEREELRKRMRK